MFIHIMSLLGGVVLILALLPLIPSFSEEYINENWKIKLEYPNNWKIIDENQEMVWFGPEITFDSRSFIQLGVMDLSEAQQTDAELFENLTIGRIINKAIMDGIKDHKEFGQDETKYFEGNPTFYTFNQQFGGDHFYQSEYFTVKDSIFYLFIHATPDRAQVIKDIHVIDSMLKSIEFLD
jgi:hypothetical protein